MRVCPVMVPGDLCSKTITKKRVCPVFLRVCPVMVPSDLYSKTIECARCFEGVPGVFEVVPGV